jgi:hypothetical protein
MCIIIDTCTIHSVFDPESSKHDQYVPVRDWVTLKRGKILIGGAKYRNELKSKKLTRLFAEFERRRALVRIDDKLVDDFAILLKKKIKDSDFDDEHLVALVAVSKCRVICTDDARAMPYLKQSHLYPAGTKRPKIYRSPRNANLCCDQNIADVCR